MFFEDTLLKFLNQQLFKS